MRVLVADAFEQRGLDGLAALGVELLSEPSLQGDELLGRLKESQPDVLIVRSTKVSGEMAAVPGLKLIVRAGAGVNTIDVAAATEAGVYVCNCPGKNAAAVAELAMGLILACDRRIPDNVAEIRAGVWNKKGYSKARGLNGRTLGVIGCGHIGQLMMRIGLAFGMRVVCFCKTATADDAAAMGATKLFSLKELAAESDVVTVHTSLTPETKGMLGAQFFEAMRPGAIFVNTARAEVVDEAALITAVREKGIRVGTDVMDGEPTTGTGEYAGALKDEAGIYVTHHIGASTDEAQEAVSDETVRIVAELLAGRTPPNAVNQPAV